MFSTIINACKSFFNHVKETVKKFTKPDTAGLAAGTISDVTRSRKDLVAENVILRHIQPTAYCSQTTGETAEVYGWRSVEIGFTISINSTLGQSTSSYSASNATTLAVLATLLIQK